MDVPTLDEVRKAIRNFDDGIESQRDSLILKNYAEAAARESAALRERVVEECAKVAESAQPALLEDATPMNGLEQIAFRMGRRAAVSAIRAMKQ